MEKFDDHRLYLQSRLAATTDQDDLSTSSRVYTTPLAALATNPFAGCGSSICDMCHAPCAMRLTHLRVPSS